MDLYKITLSFWGGAAVGAAALVTWQLFKKPTPHEATLIYGTGFVVGTTAAYNILR